MTTQNTLYHELADLLKQMKQEITKDMIWGSSIPQTYHEILTQLQQAEILLATWELDEVIELIGEINLDLLEQVDAFDTVLLKVAQQVKQIRAYHEAHQQPFPSEITLALQQLSLIVEKYTQDS